MEKKAVLNIALAEQDAEIEPFAADAHAHRREPELDRLSNIIRSLNEQFGMAFTDADRVARRIRDDIAPQVAADPDFRNARDNTPHTARMAHDKALRTVMQNLLKDDVEFYKQYTENESFRRLVTDMVFAIASAA